MSTIDQYNVTPPPDLPPPDPMIGTVIAEKYELLRLLGQGGMGAVYEGRNASTLKRCAVKVLLSPELAQHQEAVKRFFREARASSVIESDHIVQIFDSGTDPKTGFPYMVMELLNGEDIEHTLRRFGALQPLVAAKLMLQAAMGLAKAHEHQTVHRDIKPANLYLTRRESGELVVKILDFGIAKVKMEKFSETSSGLTRDGSMLGTPLYMSPEQAKGSPNIDVRSDVWSLGVVMYELLSGALPWAEASSLGELMVAIITADLPLIQDKAPWVPPELAEITHRAISRDINKRFQNAGELRDALMQIVPDGARITPDMLQGIDPNHRAYVAPRLQMTDDGMLRATTRTGLAVTQMQPPKKKPSAGLIAAAALGAVVLIGGGAAVAFSKKSNADANNASRPEPPPIIKSVIVTERVQAEIEKKTFDLIVAAPADVTVTVDDQPATLAGDKLSISGTPGATKRVKLTLGDQVQEQTVAITEGGLLPPRLELKKQAAAAAVRPAAGGAKPGAAPAAAEKPGAAAKPADAPKPANKPKVETGMDEFK
ncbi:MAG TPA: serine/threonine-protein kinase [Polyangiaceae bacterium]|nr:serine/threonine-protein kinase [Polyangiaceae bacterium]